VIPLVVASLIVGVNAAPDTRTVGRLGWRALVTFTALLFAGAIFAVVAGPPLLASLPLDDTAATTLRAAAGVTPAAQPAALPGFSEWLVSLVPANPIKAAADGAALPLIVFSILAGLAIGRLPESGRSSVLEIIGAIADAMLVLVRWILALAPVGVFALSFVLAARLGTSAAGAVLYYVVLVAVLCAAFAVGILYPVAIILGRQRPATFARAAAPAQAVAISARSSMAALPAMLEGARLTLKLPEQVSGFILPLAATTFRSGGAVMQPLGILFLAKLYGVDLSAAQLASVVVASVAVSFSIPAVPGGTILVMLPVLTAAGIPPEGVGILLGADTIPDMARTATNVTGSMAAASVLGAHEAPGDGSVMLVDETGLPGSISPA
jgi:proton glutamate symport protein